MRASQREITQIVGSNQTKQQTIMNSGINKEAGHK